MKITTEDCVDYIVDYFKGNGNENLSVHRNWKRQVKKGTDPIIRIFKNTITSDEVEVKSTETKILSLSKLSSPHNVLEILRLALYEIMFLENFGKEDIDNFDCALQHLFTEVNSKSENRKPMYKWFIDADEVLEKLDGLKNILVFNITETDLTLITFDDEYNGHLFSFVPESGKLKVKVTKQIAKDSVAYTKYKFLDSKTINNLF